MLTRLQVMMMSRITIDLKKRANDHVHYGVSSDPMVADEGGPYRHSYQLSRIRFRDPRESGRGGHSGDSDTVVDIEAAPVPRSREVSTDETLRPSRNSGGD